MDLIGQVNNIIGRYIRLKRIDKSIPWKSIAEGKHYRLYQFEYNEYTYVGRVIVDYKINEFETRIELILYNHSHYIDISKKDYLVGEYALTSL